MCLATVFCEKKKTDDEPTAIMEEAQTIEVNDDGTITCRNLFDEVRTIAGSIKSIDFARSEVYVYTT